MLRRMFPITLSGCGRGRGGRFIRDGFEMSRAILDFRDSKEPCRVHGPVKLVTFTGHVSFLDNDLPPV